MSHLCHAKGCAVEAAEEAAASTCSTCKAPVIWAVTAATGARIPLEPEPSPRGNLRLEERAGKSPIAHVEEPLFAPPGPLYLTHFARCPQAAQHRRTR